LITNSGEIGPRSRPYQPEVFGPYDPGRVLFWAWYHLFVSPLFCSASIPSGAPHFGKLSQQNGRGSARSLEDDTRNGQRKANRNPEWWGDFSQLQIQINQKSQFEFIPRDTSEFKSNQNLNSTLYREIPRNLIFSILTI